MAFTPNRLATVIKKFERAHQDALDQAANIEEKSAAGNLKPAHPYYQRNLLVALSRYYDRCYLLGKSPQIAGCILLPRAKYANDHPPLLVSLGTKSGLAYQTHHNNFTYSLKPNRLIFMPLFMITRLFMRSFSQKGAPIHAIIDDSLLMEATEFPSELLTQCQAQSACPIEKAYQAVGDDLPFKLFSSQEQGKIKPVAPHVALTQEELEAGDFRRSELILMTARCAHHTKAVLGKLRYDTSGNELEEVTTAENDANCLLSPPSRTASPTPSPPSSTSSTVSAENCARLFNSAGHRPSSNAVMCPPSLSDGEEDDDDTVARSRSTSPVPRPASRSKGD